MNLQANQENNKINNYFENLKEIKEMMKVNKFNDYVQPKNYLIQDYKIPLKYFTLSFSYNNRKFFKKIYNDILNMAKNDLESLKQLEKKEYKFKNYHSILLKHPLTHVMTIHRII